MSYSHKLERKMISFLKLLETIKKDMKNYGKTKKSIMGTSQVSEKLELNHANMIKIMENGNKMESLFKTVDLEMKKIGNIQGVFDEFEEISKIVKL